MAILFQNEVHHRSEKSKRLLAHFFENQKTSFSRCLAPGDSCDKQAIRSHSIQNARVFDLLARNGHVKMIGHTPRRDSLTIDFADVGRNEASTFLGFCSEHDSSIFDSIDNQIFDIENPEQLFLLAYRAVAKEFHSCAQSVIQLQSAYQKRVELGFDRGDVPSEAGMMAVERMMIAHETHLYKSSLDYALSAHNFKYLTHSHPTLETDEPSIAVSSFYGPFGTNKRGERSNIAINVFPISKDKTVAVFSYKRADKASVSAHLHPILKATGSHQKYLLSKEVLSYCGNFAVAPVAFDKWGPKRINTICGYFVETLRTDSALEDANLSLF